MELGFRVNGLAIASGLAGALGWFIPLGGGLTAVVFGHLAKREIKRTPALGGDGWAVAGLILGYFQLAGWIVALLVLLIVFVVSAVRSQS